MQASWRVAWRRLAPTQLSYCRAPDEAHSLRALLSRRQPPSPAPNASLAPSTTSLVASMEVVGRAPGPRRASLGARARAPGLAYYQWAFLYSRLLPPEVQYLCQAAWCGVCRAPLSSLEDAREHYMSREHQANTDVFLDAFFEDSPRLRPARRRQVERRLWEQVYDRPLPEALLELCGDDACRLCGVTFPDEVEMMRHYLRAPHQRAVRHYLHLHHLGTPALRPEVLGRSYWYLQWRGQRVPREVLVRCTATHCHLCHLHLPDRTSAEHHYSSPRHAAAVDAALQHHFAGTAVGPPGRVEVEEVHRWRSTFPHLPEEVVARCGEERCGLCSAELANLGVARNHYHSRHHLAVVTRYLEYLEAAGKPSKVQVKPFQFEI